MSSPVTRRITVKRVTTLNKGHDNPVVEQQQYLPQLSGSKMNPNIIMAVASLVGFLFMVWALLM